MLQKTTIKIEEVWQKTRQIFGQPRRDVAENANAQSRKLVEGFKEQKQQLKLKSYLKKLMNEFDRRR